MADGNVFDELENSSTEPAVGQTYEDWWKPSEMGGHLMGVIVEIHSAPEQFTDEGEVPDPIYTILSVGRGDFEAGEAYCAKTHVQLLRGLEGAGLGDLVTLKHKGLERTDNGNAANTYEVGVIDEETWQESDQADEIQEVIDGYSGATGDNRRTEPYSTGGSSRSSSSSASTSSSSGALEDSEAAEFFQDVIEMQNGEMPVENANKMLQEVRDFDVGAEELADALGWDVSDGTVTA